MRFEIKEGVLKKVEAMDSETSMIIPDDVTRIDSFNSYSIKKLISVTLPDSITHVGGLGGIANQDKWDNIIVSKKNKRFTSIDGVLYNKSLTELIRCPTGKVSVNIPDSVTSIADHAFYFCSNLASVTIPDSVTRIGSSAFTDCKKLTSITIPCDVTTIESGSFFACTELTSILIPDRVTRIEDAAFQGCLSLASIRIGENVEYIGEYALYRCDKLSSILISDKNISFRMLDGVLYGNNMTDLVKCLPNISECFIPDSVVTIGVAAFSRCEKLTSIIIPDTVESIGEQAFSSCSALKSIILSRNVGSIEASTFANCTSLTSIAIPDSVTSIGRYVFSDCTSLISIYIPNGTTNIEDDTFENCPNLTINAPANSYAESYSSKNEINFVAKSNYVPAEAKHGYEANLTNKSSSAETSKKSKFKNALKVRLDQCLEMYKRLAGFCEDKEENEAIDYLQGYFLLLCFALSNGSARVNQKKLDCLEYYIQVSLDESTYPETMRRMNCTKEKIKQFLDTPPEPLVLCIIADNTITSSPIDITTSEFFIRIVEDFASELANCNDVIDVDEISAAKDYAKMLRDFVDESSKMDNVFRLLGTENYLNIMMKMGAL